MSTNFSTSETRLNLMRAFAGESQARNRYTLAQEKAQQQGQYVISALFKFTADQEKAHAKVFYEHLSELSGSTIKVDGGYPVDISSRLCDLLKMATHNENQEADDVYPAFAETARAEGFAKVAQDFENIAQIERSHSARFKKFHDLCTSGRLFSSDKPERWVCMNCGFILESEQAPQKCPVCGVDQGYYIRLEMAAWGL